MKERVYSGQRREAFLWMCWSVLCIALALFILLALSNSNFGNLVLPSRARLPEGYICVFGAAPCALFFKRAAKMVGASVHLRQERIEVTEWYGRKWSLAIEKPVWVDRRMRVKLFWGVGIEIPIPLLSHVYRLKVGEYELYLNLAKFADPSSEVEQIVKFLQSAAL